MVLTQFAYKRDLCKGLLTKNAVNIRAIRRMLSRYFCQFQALLHVDYPIDSVGSIGREILSSL